MTCPTCGHVTKPATAKALVHPGPDASPTAIVAYYKATAPVEDLRFVARAVPALAEAVSAILTTRQPTKRDALAMFDRARHLLTPQPVINEAAFWRYHVTRMQPARDAAEKSRRLARASAEAHSSNRRRTTKAA